MIIGELKCKYCGATLVSFDGDLMIAHNAIVQENYIFCANCKNIIKSDILMSLFGPDTVDKLYEMMEEDEEELKKFEGLPVVEGEVVVQPVFTDNNKIYKNCVFVVGQIRDSNLLMIRDSTLIVPASALLKCYPLIKNCESIALINIEIGILEQFIDTSVLLNQLPFDRNLFTELLGKEVT